VASREWFKEKATLPFLLIITPERDQEMSFERVAAIFLTEISGLVIRTTTMTRLVEQGLLAPIWYQVLPRCERNEAIPRHSFFD
jgi:hypothetical protein